jgi:hypothetical protein
MITNFSDLLDSNLDLRETSDKIHGPCPVHQDSDNPNGFCLYKNTGKWFCFTNNCHLNHNNDIETLYSLLGKECKFSCKQNHYTVLPNIRQEILYDINCIDSLSKPQYFIDRGYSEFILKKYRVGFCDNYNKNFYNRCVVPVFNDLITKIVGFTARTIYEKCIMCDCYHQKYKPCLDSSYSNNTSKWINSTGFVKTNYLYNSWLAKLYPNKPLIITEGPGDIWKLVQNKIYNCVCVFGIMISPEQYNKILELKPSKIIVAGNNDEAGSKLVYNTWSKFAKLFPIDVYYSKYNDISDLTDKETYETFYSNNWACGA